MAESFGVLAKKKDIKKYIFLFLLRRVIISSFSNWQIAMSLFSIWLNIYKHITMLPNLII